ncbi:ANTAR domain-containing protein [Nocardioides sp. GXQ0305]|uniref:ANTAR domain-containing protein n=1 Tax=Nocardioides sp. GXQ0305 TaxID=3423912 RepID=UPI003D7EDC13
MRQPARPTTTSAWGLVAEFARTQRLGDESTRLEALCGAAAEVLSVPAAAVTSAEGAHLASAPAQPAPVGVLDTVQYAQHSGPGLTATTSGVAVRVDDTRADGRWPAFLEAATSAGFRAVLTVPLTRGERVDASLSAYSRSPRSWSDDDEGAAVVLAAIATAWATGTEVLREQAKVVAQLQHALDSRVLIEQAKGVLAAVERVRPDAAFELMRGHARRRGIPVREVAEAVVRLGFRPPPTTSANPSGVDPGRGVPED